MVLIKVQRFDHRCVANCKPDPPSSHIIRFGKRVNFDSCVFCPLRFEKADRPLAVVADRTVGKIVDDANSVRLGKPDSLFEKTGVAWAPVGLFG